MKPISRDIHPLTMLFMRSVTTALALFIFAEMICAQTSPDGRAKSKQDKRGLGVHTTKPPAPAAPPNPTPGKPIADSAKTRPELILQTGHSTSEILSLALSPDDQLLATAGGDGKIKLWMLGSGYMLRTLDGISYKTFAVSFSPDGQMLASAGMGGKVQLWDVATARVLRTMPGQSEGISSVVFSPDGQMLASAGFQGGIKVWSVATGREISIIVGHPTSNDMGEFPVSALAFTVDGKLLISAGTDGKVKLWNATTGRLLRTLIVHSEGKLMLALHPDGSTMATGGADGKISLWDIRTGQQMRSTDGGGRAVAAISFDSVGRLLSVFEGDDGKLTVKDVATGRVLLLVESSRTNGTPCVLSRSGKLLALNPLESVQVWDIATTRKLELAGGADWGSSLAFSADGRLVALVRKERLKLWDVFTGRGSYELADNISAIAFSSDSRLLASGGKDGKLRIWEAATGRELNTWLGHSDEINSLVFSPDGHLLVSSSENPLPANADGSRSASSLARDKVKLWDVSSGRELRSVTGVAAINFSPDGRTLAFVNQAMQVGLLNVTNGRESSVLINQGGMLYAFTSNAQGRLLASADGLSGKIAIWDADSGQKLKSISGHPFPNKSAEGGVGIEALAFSADGRLLASAASDRLVKLWDTATGRELHTFAGHSTSVRRIAFLSEGRVLATGDDSGSLRFWNIKTGEMVATASLLPNDADWLVLSPDGLFDGSPAGWNNILWRFSENTFDVQSVEVFFREFYYPGLLADILSGKRVEAPRRISSLDRRQPILKLTAGDEQSSGGQAITTRTVKLAIEITEAPADKDHQSGSGARDVRLFRNGSLVKLWRGDVFEGKGRKIVLDASVPIIAGENRLTAYSFNRDNIKSPNATLIVTGSPRLSRAGTAYILAVGINEYSNSDYNLKYAVADAQTFADEFLRQQTRLAAFANTEVISLLDRDATKANILAAFDRLAGKQAGPVPSGLSAALNKIKPVEPEDAVIVYFAGHGTAQQQRFYLIPHDLSYSGSRAGLDETGLKKILEHSISDLEMEQAFESIDAGQCILIIDACNSGQALEAEEKRRGPMNSKGLAQLAYEKGMYILTAAQSYQAALEVAEVGHGLLTYTLLEEGLKRLAADIAPKDGQVVVREWLDYATQRVPQMQMQKMQRARSLKHDIAFVNGEEEIPELERRSLQHPRVFYRREPEARPLVVAKP